MNTREDLIRSYDLLAEEYARVYGDELAHKPSDRELLKRFVAAVPAGRPVCDLGCGPGHVAAHLRSLGVEALGIDLSPNMIRVAKRRHPGVEYRVGDMFCLDLPSESLGGIVALYSLIHVPRERLDAALREMSRVLVPGGLIVVAFHRGDGELHAEEALGQPVAFDCTLFQPEEMSRAMLSNGYSIQETIVRDPYEVEYPSERVYIVARKDESRDR